jgi:type III restriction enzyme
VIGDLKEDGEEHDCAIAIDRHPKIKKWVRNTAKDHSFWLQTATGRFYPDFVALLQDGRVAVIEYKGAHIDDNEIARQKRLIGKCWADHSNGQCLFIWIADRQFSQLDQALA